MATRAEITVNGVAGSNDDVTLAALVQLNNNGLGDEATYEWTLLGQPSPLDTVLSSTSIQAPTFTPTKEGSYLLQLVVNKGLPDEQSDRVIVAVRELETRNRIPAAGETTENNGTTGWANTAVDQILQRVTRFVDDGVLVGTAGQAGLVPLDVVYAADVTTIATGLPGQREVPLWQRASAATSSTVLSLLGVVLGGVDGNPAPAAGALVRVAVLQLLQSVPLGTTGLTAGTPVYVDDLGRLSATSGTTIRQVGSVLDDMGAGNYGIWVTGEGTFGTIQGVTGTAPVQVAPGVSPDVSLATSSEFALTGGALDLSETGVVAGAYGDPAATPESIVPAFTVDAKGRLTLASAAPVQIGGYPAQTYVDAGDDTTLALAQAFAQSLAYGVSSKVPVHTGTTIPLPACTVNGTFQTLTANVHGPLLPANTDGHDLLVGERLLVKDQAAPANNGIYVLTQKGATSGPSSPWILTRADDANSGPELCGSLVTVNVGNTLAGSAWLFAFNPASFTLGTTPVQWSQLNAVPATDTVLGTVRLQGALAGLGSTATEPRVALNTGYVTGQLPASAGGTGLNTSGAANAFLVGNGAGGWTTRTAYEAGSVLSGSIAAPSSLRSVTADYGEELPITVSDPATPKVTITFPGGEVTSRIQPNYGGNLQLQSGAHFMHLTAPGSLTLFGGDRGPTSTGGDIWIKAGNANPGYPGADTRIDGGAGTPAGKVSILGGGNVGTIGTGGVAELLGGDGIGSSVYGGEARVDSGNAPLGGNTVLIGNLYASNIALARSGVSTNINGKLVAAQTNWNLAPTTGAGKYNYIPGNRTPYVNIASVTTTFPEQNRLDLYTAPTISLDGVEPGTILYVGITQQFNSYFRIYNDSDYNGVGVSGTKVILKNYGQYKDIQLRDIVQFMFNGVFWVEL